MPLRFLLVTLSIWRVAYMVALERGPFSAFYNLRSWVFGRFPDTWVDEGINCPLCISFWLSLLALLTPLRKYGVWGWLGVAGGAMGLHLFTSKN